MVCVRQRAPRVRARPERAGGARRRRGLAFRLLVASFLFLYPLAHDRAGADGTLPSDIEYQIKASFVYTVAKFVDWPSSAFPEADSPLTLGVIGDDAMSRGIANALKGKRVHDRDLVVRRVDGPVAPAGCQILYIGEDAPSALPAVLARVGTAGVLTVGEAPGFADRGGILGLTLRESLVQFEVNIAAARKAGLVISSKILRLGRVVGSARPAAEGRR